MECARTAWCATLALAVLAAAGPRYSSRIVHTQAGAIRGIIVEPASRRLEPVEVFRGVPYAGRPPRLGAPPPPPSWSGTRLADTFAPVCPQKYPDISNKTAALSRMPLGVYKRLRALTPLLANQSEDCLYLNIYVPGSGARGVEAPYAVVVWAAGGEVGSGNALDAAALAARARLLVVTLNYRVGLLGYLTPDGSHDVGRWGGAAMLDVSAALLWTRANVAAFGGDPSRLTLAAHADAAALANNVLMMPLPKGTISRALLLSGSSLSASALAPDAALTRTHVASALRCARDSTEGEHWLISCIRNRPLAALLAVEPPRARFLAGWAPSLPARDIWGNQGGVGGVGGMGGTGGAGGEGSMPGGAAARALHTSEVFLDCALAVVVATTESYHFFNEDEIRHGFEEEHRSRILRTYVRNTYRYHRNEIYAAIRNEYTDWERPIQHPINIRDATLEALSDGATAAPALALVRAHATRGASTYFAHFAHHPKDTDYPQRLGSVTDDTLPFFLGLPLLSGNYSRTDAAVADATVSLLAAFAKTGDPSPRDLNKDPLTRDSGSRDSSSKEPPVVWPRYDLNTQQYLSIGSKQRIRSHYRGHKLALWLHLLPQLHRRGAPAHHHAFRDIEIDTETGTGTGTSTGTDVLYAGEIFPDIYTTPSEESTEEEQVEECEPPPSARPALSPDTPPPPLGDSLALDNHYYSYTVALAVTVGAGCFLLALNLLVFAGIYLQRGRRNHTRNHRRPLRDGSIQSVPSTPCTPTAAATVGAVGAVGAVAALSPATPTLTKSSLKRSSEAELKDRPNHVTHKKRVQIQEISV